MQSAAALALGREYVLLRHSRCGPSGSPLKAPEGSLSLWPCSRRGGAALHVPSAETCPGVCLAAARRHCHLPDLHGQSRQTAGPGCQARRSLQQTAQVCIGRRGRAHIERLQARELGTGRQGPSASTSAVAALAQEGRSKSEGATEEAVHQLEDHVVESRPLEENETGPVIIRVRECADGSFIFDFGDAAERPEQDPLDAFVRGAPSAEEAPPESIAASTELQASQGVDEAEEDLPVEADAAQSSLTASSEGGSVVESSGPSLRLNSGGSSLPHPAKVEKGGEDAFFCTENGKSSYVGVSDGVGGWATLGINAGLYSRELMYHCQRLAGDDILPRSMLIRAHKMTKATGSATAMVARLRGNRLRVANLGDSGFLLVRDGQVALASTQMQHAFNFPFQIGSKGGDDPDAAKDYEVEVERGDLLILGTDGLHDNLFEREIAEAAAILKSKGVSPQLASQQIAAFAQQRSVLKGGLSPFAVQADAAGYKHLGGKPDDITVVVAYIE
ncbi:hypothetical protein KFL_001180090 [Klebsormidium nitens]|uniref:Protein phosphatase n=1 Tax=Klebsormidium nitens TaxID=105231 RepID=A0A1Y1HVG9_KLENI|nr:hypothetical protein KFL_001180090 [Klebsormidium nitens]|eukprot:GAQ82630.1 hypothetical protein KFL_001180090 [Klebsormidium nitens]